MLCCISPSPIHPAINPSAPPTKQGKDAARRATSAPPRFPHTPNAKQLGESPRAPRQKVPARKGRTPARPRRLRRAGGGAARHNHSYVAGGGSLPPRGRRPLVNSTGLTLALTSLQPPPPTLPCPHRLAELRAASDHQRSGGCHKLQVSSPLRNPTRPPNDPSPSLVRAHHTVPRACSAPHRTGTPAGTTNRPAAGTARCCGEWGDEKYSPQTCSEGHMFAPLETH